MGINVIECTVCGHREWWEDGNYFGEKTDMAHHWCGVRGYYKPCGPDCDHDFPGCNQWRKLAREKE